MERKDYRPRLIDNIIDSYLEAFGAVCVEGPKWCGKTWTSSYHCQSEIMLGNPDGNFQNRQLAQMSPSLVLEGETPRLMNGRKFPSYGMLSGIRLTEAVIKGSLY